MSQNTEHDAKLPSEEIAAVDVPSGIDRRKFLVRSTVIGAAAILTGCDFSKEERTERAAKEAAAMPDTTKKAGTVLSPDLEVVKKSKGPVMTVVDEFYKVGPGPSSSHTIGPI